MTVQTIQQVSQVLASAPPGSRMLVCYVETPPATTMREDSEPAVAVLELPREGAGEGAVTEAPAAKDAGGPGVEVAALDQALAYQENHPAARLSARQWSRVISKISEREFDRAVDAGALAFEARGEGKGHRARVIRAQEMVRYLGLCEAVQAGREPMPAWWHEVRKGVNADVA